MTTPRWGLFAAAAMVLALGLLVLSRATARTIDAAGEAEPVVRPGRPGTDRNADDAEPTADDPERPTARPPPAMPTGGALLANVALTHGLLAAAVLGLAWYAGLPWEAIGLGEVSSGALGAGLAVGVGLYAASEAAGALADRAGIEYDERLRELLAPERPADWTLLLLVILPLVAAAEELLFRGALIGAVAFGFGVPATVVVVASSVLFGAGHSAQGPVGMAATTAMGLVLGAAFVLTGSLAAVVVAHYVVNALEFVVREGVYG